MEIKRFLGDSVYADYDGYHVALYTKDYNGCTNNVIYLTPDVYIELTRYVEELKVELNKQKTQGTTQETISIPEKGAALIEMALLICIISMVSFGALARMGYYNAASFCRPVQTLADEGTVVTGVTNSGKCKWEDGGMTKNYQIQRLF